MFGLLHTLDMTDGTVQAMAFIVDTSSVLLTVEIATNDINLDSMISPNETKNITADTEYRFRIPEWLSAGTLHINLHH